MSDDAEALRSNILQYPVGRATGPIGGGPLTPGGGGHDGIEARLAKLEAGQEFTNRFLAQLEGRLEKSNDTLAQIDKSLARLEEKAASKGFIVTALTIALGLLAAATVFGSQIRGLVGVG